MSGELIEALQLGGSWEADADAPPSFVNRVPFVVPPALVIDLHMCLVSNHFDGAGFFFFFFCSSFNLEIGERNLPIEGSFFLIN